MHGLLADDPRDALEEVGPSSSLAEAGVRAISFNMNSSSMVWGVLSNHASEVRQIVDVCAWAKQTWARDSVMLFGSSAGAPQAGSAPRASCRCAR